MWLVLPINTRNPAKTSVIYSSMLQQMIFRRLSQMITVCCTRPESVKKSSFQYPLFTIWGVTLTETPWTETFLTETSLDRNPLERERPGQRNPGQKSPLDREPPGQRPHPTWKEHGTRDRDPLKEHGSRQPDSKWHYTETPPPVNRMTNGSENITLP